MEQLINNCILAVAIATIEEGSHLSEDIEAIISGREVPSRRWFSVSGLDYARMILTQNEERALALGIV